MSRNKVIEYPSKRSFLSAPHGRPIARKLQIGDLTPVNALIRAWKSPGRFLLESTRRGGSMGRYSFVGGSPRFVFQSKGKGMAIQEIPALLPGDGYTARDRPPFYTLRRLLAEEFVPQDPSLPPFQGGAVGYFSYELVRQWERLPEHAQDDLNLPEVVLLFVDLITVFDHAEGDLWLIFNPGGARFRREKRIDLWDEGTERIDALSRSLFAPGEPEEEPFTPILFRPFMARDEYVERVRRCQEYIAAGDIFQANLSHRFSAPIGVASPLSLYRRLSAVNPSPFSAYLDLGEFSIVGSSPERLIKRSDNHVETRPIAGTRPRGAFPDEDRRLAEELLFNEKERAEHIMLVDLERNDLGKISRFGSVKVDEWMGIERYSHVLHIVSNVRGELLPGKDAIDLLQAVFPGGTVTGVPKIRCMEIIDGLEPVVRGPYTGAIGYLGAGGDLDLSIAIRTLVIKKETLYLQVGAGIVADSHPEREYEETLHKAAAAKASLTARRHRPD